MSMSNYIRCNNTGKQWKEILLVEGNSASGSARNGELLPYINPLKCWESLTDNQQPRHNKCKVQRLSKT